MDHNNVVMAFLDKFRKEITHKDHNTENKTLNDQFEMLHLKQIGCNIMAADPEHPKGYNQFNWHMRDQKNWIT